MSINEACQVWIEQRIKEELEDGRDKSLREIGRVIAAEIEKVFEAKVSPETIRKKVERIGGTNVPPVKTQGQTGRQRITTSFCSEVGPKGSFLLGER